MFLIETTKFRSRFDSYIGKDDKLALLLDFDGTLSPLAPHPDLAEIDHESEAALHSLASNPNTYLAIISGRSAEDAREKVKLEKITYAGNHGLEIIFWNKSRYHHEIDAETRQKYDKMVTELETSVSVKATHTQSLPLYFRLVWQVIPILYLFNYNFFFDWQNSSVAMALGLRIRSNR